MLNTKELVGNPARNSKDTTSQHKVKNKETISKLIKKIYNKTHII